MFFEFFFYLVFIAQNGFAKKIIFVIDISVQLIGKYYLFFVQTPNFFIFQHITFLNTTTGKMPE